MPWEAVQLTGADAAIRHIELVVEEPLQIVLNGRLVATLMRLPGDERELAAGFCFTEGLVAQWGDIMTVSHCSTAGPEAEGPDERNRVDVRAAGVSFDGSLWPSQIRSGCGRIDVASLDLSALVPVKSGLTIAGSRLLGLGDRLRRLPVVYARTGGLHAAGLFAVSGEAQVVREDIGRHNAMDKVIGHALLRGIRLDDGLIVTTGRASHEMVVKAVRAGSPILASFSSATSLAVELADRLGLTLVGYLRGGRATVYTHPERVTAG